MEEALIGHKWQSHIRRTSEKKKQEAERQRSKRNECERERTKVQWDCSASRSDEIDHASETAPMSVKYHKNIHELGVNQHTEFPRSREAPPSPPASDLYDASVDDIVQALQDRIDSQGAAIKDLEFELRAEQSRVQELQTARHEAVQAQRQAVLADNQVEAVARERAKVAGLIELLDQSTEREKELERAVHEGKKRELELRDQLLEVQRGVREREEILRRLELREASRVAAQSAELGSGTSARGSECPSRRVRQLQQQQRLVPEMSGRGPSEAASEIVSEAPPRNPFRPMASGRSRKQDKQMRTQGFISIPSASGNRELPLSSL